MAKEPLTKTGRRPRHKVIHFKPKPEFADGLAAFDQDIANEICKRLSDGESLRGIIYGENSRSPNPQPVDGMCPLWVVLRWVGLGELEDSPSHLKAFATQYARARQEQADALADSVVHIADTTDDPNKARLQIDARKWYAGKVRPKVYGEGIQLRHANADGTGPVQVEQTTRVAIIDRLLDAIPLEVTRVESLPKPDED